MPLPPIPPVGADVSLPPLTAPEPTSAAGGGGFGRALADEIARLDASQVDAAQKSQQLATGQAQDVSSVVIAVEKASLEVQLATQIRNKVVEAYQEIFRMQV